MSRKTRVHTIDSSSLSQLDEDGDPPTEQLVSMKFPCSFQLISGGAAGGITGYVFTLMNAWSLRTQSLRAFHKSALENGASFAYYGGVFSVVLCFAKRIRQKDDVWNGAIAGCTTGLATSWKEGPVAAVKQCAFFGGTYVLFEWIGKYLLPEAQALSIYDASFPQHKAAGEHRIRPKSKPRRNSRFSYDCRQCQSPFWLLRDRSYT